MFFLIYIKIYSSKLFFNFFNICFVYLLYIVYIVLNYSIFIVLIFGYMNYRVLNFKILWIY